MIQSNLKSQVGSVLALVILLLSSFVFVSELKYSYTDSENVIENVIDTSKILADNTNNEGSRATTRPVQDDVHGGEWMDSFEDDSKIDWAMCDHLKLDAGDAEINGSYILDPNAIGVWHFDEGSGITAFDSTSNNNDGILGGDGSGSDLPSWTTGKFNNALSFDGTDDIVLCKNDPSLNITSKITIESWIYVNTWREFERIVSRWESSYSGRSYLLWLGETFNRNTIRFGVCNGNKYESVESITQLYTNQWYHVVGVYTISELQIYINGSLDISRASTITSIQKTNRNVAIGSDPGGDYYFDGKIDEVTIYDRALSANEIKNNYENGPNQNFLFANLTTKPITLPPEMHWDTLMINKAQPDKTYLNITILNASNNQPIPGSLTYSENGEVDISNIDPVKYPSIKLNATFDGYGTTTPELHYWAVSWNRSNTWQDTLFGGEKVESSENVEEVDGDVQLEHGGFDFSAMGLWHFDESSGQVTVDSSGNGNDGQLGSISGIDSNDPIWTTGQKGGALDFDGVDDYVDFGDVNDITAYPFSFSAWIFPNTLGENNYGAILTNGGQTADQEGYCFVLNHLSGFRVGVSDGVTIQSINSASLIKLGMWQHIVVSVDVSKVPKFYLNGTLISTGNAFTITPAANTLSLLIGEGTNENLAFDGKIDEVAIYNRALTAQEINGNYQNSSHGFEQNGTLTSNSISLPSQMYWDTLKINKTEPQDTSLNVTVLDGTSNQPITSFNNLTGTELDLSLVNPIVHGSIKLFAAFGSKRVNTSILHDWSVNWTENTAPKFIDIKSPSSVNRTKSVQICINVSDKEESEENLTIKVEYKGPSYSIWVSNCLSPLNYSTDHWHCTFTPLSIQSIGDYSFRVTINDSFQYENITIHQSLIEVINNKPTQPDVYISPSNPRTADDLRVYAYNSTDIDLDKHSTDVHDYWFHWYKNGEFIPKFENRSLVWNKETQKDDIWRCLVYVFDGYDLGVPGEAEVVIQNTPPEIKKLFTVYEMFEDEPVILENKLLEIFTDIDNESLIYSASGQKKINVEINQENGSIKFTPALNWFGTEAITFYANDKNSIATQQTVSVVVKPTNDLPEIIQIGNQMVSHECSELGFIVKQDAWLNLTVVVEDIDGDVDRGMIQYLINKTVQSNFYFLDSENKLVYWPTNADVGIHYINISITDNNETPPVYISQNIWIQVLNVNDPPSVEIISPKDGLEFMKNDKITFICKSDDNDFLIPGSIETHTYRWFINESGEKDIGFGQTLFNQTLDLRPGNYSIGIEVKDSAGATAYDYITITIKEHFKDSTGASQYSTEMLWWLVIIIIIIIVVLLCIFFLMYNNKKKRRLEAMGIPQQPEQILQPDRIYSPPSGMSTTPGPPLPKQQVIDDRSSSVTETVTHPQDIITPPLTSITTISTPAPQPTEHLPPGQVQEASRINEQSLQKNLELLEIRLLKGEISEETYLTMKTQYEMDAKPNQAALHLLPPATLDTESEQEPASLPQTEMLPEMAVPTIETEIIQEPIVQEPTSKIPPDAYKHPEHQVQESLLQQVHPVEAPQSQQTPTITITPQQAPTRPLTTPCPLCNQQIAEYTNPCPHCGGVLEWEDGV